MLMPWQTDIEYMKKTGGVHFRYNRNLVSLSDKEVGRWLMHAEAHNVWCLATPQSQARGLTLVYQL